MVKLQCSVGDTPINHGIDVDKSVAVYNKIQPSPDAIIPYTQLTFTFTTIQKHVYYSNARFNCHNLSCGFVCCHNSFEISTSLPELKTSFNFGTSEGEPC